MVFVSLKDAQIALQKTITWRKKSRKGCIEWDKSCIEVGLSSRNLKILMKTRFSSKVVAILGTFHPYSSSIFPTMCM